MPTRSAPLDEPTGGDAAVRGDAAPRGRFARARRAVARLVRTASASAVRRARSAAATARRADRRRPWLRVGLFALAGAALAVALAGRVPAKVGPFETTMSVRPALDGHTMVHLAPLGTIDFDTHDWPVAVDLRVEEIAVADAERIAEDPREIERLGEDAADEARAAMVGLSLRALAVAVLGGLAGALVARPSWPGALAGAAVGTLLVATLGLGSWATFRSEAVAEPQYTGLLTRAPAAVGDIEAVLDRFGEYRAQLADLVDNMATLYLAGSELPVFEADSRLVRVLHVSDVHLNPEAFDLMARLADQFAVDAIADTGDLTDWGTQPEAGLLSRIGDLDVPYIYVRGNHDSLATQAAVAAAPNAVVLDGGGATVAGLRFWGIGDPRYTPDKSAPGDGSEQEQAAVAAPRVAAALAEGEPPAVDVAMVHDERMAADLGGQVPLVLAGHTHEPDEATLDPPGSDDGDAGAPEGDDGSEAAGTPEGGASTSTTAAPPPDEETMLLVEGSTGGAGLRGLQGAEPEPLTASILYFDPGTRRLVAYDRLSVAWLEDAGATIQRHIVGTDDARSPSPEG